LCISEQLAHKNGLYEDHFRAISFQHVFVLLIYLIKCNLKLSLGTWETANGYTVAKMGKCRITTLTDNQSS